MSTKPKIILTDANGAEHDITDSIPFMYDAIIQSLDWGSGFLDLEETLHIALVGVLAGYEVPDVVEIEGHPKPDVHDYTRHLTSNQQWRSREREVAMSKYQTAHKEWCALYRAHAHEAILKGLKRFEMDEDN